MIQTYIETLRAALDWFGMKFCWERWLGPKVGEKAYSIYKYEVKVFLRLVHIRLSLSFCGVLFLCTNVKLCSMCISD